MSTETTSFPKDQIRVVLLEKVHARADEVFAAAGYAVERIDRALSPDELIDAAGDAHVIGVRSRTAIPPEALGRMPRLLAAGCFCIGTDHVALDAARTRGTPVFNSPFGNTRSVAELTIAECVALSRRLGDRSAQMHAGEWVKSAAGAKEVRGKTLGIVGYGHIGSQVSVLAEAMGMRVMFFDTASKLPLGNASHADSLVALLEASDIVTLHVPDTPATQGLIGAAEIARMKPGAMLINNARGSVVDIPALAAALRERRLAGAAADVFPIEPGSPAEPFESELRGLDNVILTPHVGGSTEEAQATIADDVATKLVRFLDNGSTTGAVNVPEVELPSQAVTSGTRPHRILHFHRNVPGVLSRLHGSISELGVNVLGEYLQTDPELGYVVLDVDPRGAEGLGPALKKIPDTVRLRVLW
ncbi:MAG: phosphoglycerate dehydrogenase [Planctomycetota bacterium]